MVKLGTFCGGTDKLGKAASSTVSKVNSTYRNGEIVSDCLCEVNYFFAASLNGEAWKN